MPQYQGVWTLEQQAQAQSNQQWVTDPNFKNTTLLLQADGTGSGSQNNTFLDGSTNNFFITRNGNTTQGSFSPFSQAPGYWGNYLGGAGNYFQTPASSASTIVGTLSSTANLTIECWIYPTAYNSSANFPGLIGDMQATFENNNWSWGITNTGTLMLYWNSGSQLRAYTTNTVSLNTWTHIALNVASGAITMYINGVSQTLTGTTTLSTPSSSNNYLVIGQWNNGSGGTGGVSNGLFTGYISNLRVVKASTYTSNFTPSTTPLTAITNTSLLYCQSNRFVDNSSNALAITTGGTPSVQAFGPFAPALQWTPDVVGGSGYFDGTGDYLAVPSSSAFSLTGDFTYEGWVYVTSTSTNRYIMPSTVSMNLDVVVATGNNMKLQFFDGSTATTDAINTFPINTWAHIAFVRSGSGANNCSFYVNGVRGTQFSNNTTNSSPSIDIGRYSAGGNFYGYMGSLRIVNGQAVYSGATYTVPNASLTTTGYGTTSQSITASNTKLLLNYTNAGIYDGKMAMNLETVSTAQVATAPVKYGSGSMKFNGTSDYLVSFNNVPMGTGDCTIEAWVYPTYTGSGVYAIFTTGPGGTTGNLRFGVYASTLYLDITGATVFSSTGPTIPTNVWVHMAVTRANGIWRGFINGVLMGSTSTQGTTSIVGTERYVGLLGSTGAAGGVPGGWWSGYIDDLRVTQGVARYIANFTPPQQALPRQ